MRILSWLFGKKAETASVAVGDDREKSSLKPANDAVEQIVPPSQPHEPGNQALADSASENLRRWRESGQARAWVEGRKGCWNHQDWLSLLEELRRSVFWPMNTDAVGLALEEIKRECLRRN